jgi:hypothetical protein
MPPRSLLRSFLGLWIATGLVLLIGSAETVRDAWVGSRHANPHVVLLGGIEALAALFFLVPRTIRFGAVGLLGTIGIAFAVHIALGQFRGDLVLYGAAVLFVMVHGPLTGMQWRAATRGQRREQESV